MTQRADGPWAKTVFDTKEWIDAWSRSTIEKVAASDDGEPPMYAVEWSPFWEGYKVEGQVGQLWDRPVLTIGSLYAFYGPSYLLNESRAVEETLERAAAHAKEWGTAGVLVANLPEDAALRWAEIRPPDASIRLDVAYHRTIGEGADPVVGDVASSVRRDWRRRWRRATEQGLQLLDESEPDPKHVDEVLGFATETATKHDWPPAYDRTTVDEVLRMPNARLLRADLHGQTVAGMVALEHDRRLYLWAGGFHPELLHELSPYLVIFYELLATGEERGLERLEFGRGNDQFKRKYGFDDTDTWSLWYASRPEEVSTYAPRLAALDEGLSRFMGIPPRILGQPPAS